MSGVYRRPFWRFTPPSHTPTLSTLILDNGILEVDGDLNAAAASVTTQVIIPVNALAPLASDISAVVSKTQAFIDGLGELTTSIDFAAAAGVYVAGEGELVADQPGLAALPNVNVNAAGAFVTTSLWTITASSRVNINGELISEAPDIYNRTRTNDWIVCVGDLASEPGVTDGFGDVYLAINGAMMAQSGHMMMDNSPVANFAGAIVATPSMIAGSVDVHLNLDGLLASAAPSMELDAGPILNAQSSLVPAEPILAVNPVIHINGSGSTIPEPPSIAYSIATHFRRVVIQIHSRMVPK